MLPGITTIPRSSITLLDSGAPATETLVPSTALSESPIFANL